MIVECRGKKEDNELELEFRQLCDGNNRLGIALPFDVLFSDKKAMSSGLQLADLVARPIGLNVFKPKQHNRAFEVLKRKFYCDGGRDKVGRSYEGARTENLSIARKRKAPMKLTEAKTPTGHPQSTWPDYTANKQNTANLELVTNSIG